MYFIPKADTYLKNTSWIKIGLLFIVIVGAILRIFYLYEEKNNPLLSFVAQSPVFDQFNFIQLALDILNTPGQGSPVSKFSPVYSHFLALVFKIFRN